MHNLEAAGLLLPLGLASTEGLGVILSTGTTSNLID